MQNEQRIRIALGVFDDLSRLNHTLGEFEAFGLDAGRTTVIAEPGALGGRLEADFERLLKDGRTAVPNLLIRRHSDAGPTRYVDRPSRVSPFLPLEHLLRFEDWITARLSNDLNEQLAAGACLLIAPITAVQHEWRVSNVLLKYSTTAVQLHDLAIPR